MSPHIVFVHRDRPSKEKKPMANTDQTDDYSLFDSRKFKALILTIIMCAVPILGAVAALIAGRASFADLTEMTKYAFGSISFVASVFIGAIAHEKASAAKQAPITAAGDVTVNRTVNNTMPPPALDTAPPSAGASTAFKAATITDPLAPTLPGVPRPPTGFKSIVGLAFATTAIVIGGATVEGCTWADAKKDARGVIDATTATCVVIQSDNSLLGKICATEEELAPIVQHLLEARQFKAAHPGAKSSGKQTLDACELPK